MESADSDVADITELEKPDRPEAGLEKRPGAWPLHLSSDQEQVESGLALLLAGGQEVVPFTAEGREEHSQPVSIVTVCVCVQRGKAHCCRHWLLLGLPPPPFSEGDTKVEPLQELGHHEV